jgi:hypothetical protein
MALYSQYKGSYELHNYNLVSEPRLLNWMRPIGYQLKVRLILRYGRSEVLTPVNIAITMYWDVTPCSLATNV